MEQEQVAQGQLQGAVRPQEGGGQIANSRQQGGRPENQVFLPSSRSSPT